MTWIRSAAGRSPVATGWLALIATTFLIGCTLVALRPAQSPDVVTVGVCCNVTMAVLVGGVSAWQVRCRRLPHLVALGAVLTVGGIDLLVLSLHSGFGGTFVLYDLVAIPVALAGMSVLLGLGAVVGGTARRVSRGPAGLTTTPPPWRPAGSRPVDTEHPGWNAGS